MIIKRSKEFPGRNGKLKKWRSVLIRPSDDLLTAIKVLDVSALQIALVVDDDEHLLGTITDGDIRRGILRGIPLNSSLDQVMNKSPFFIYKGYDRNELIKTMTAREYSHAPVVDDKNCIVDLIKLDNLIRGTEQHSNWVVLMAGGQGTRLRPLTEAYPKPLISVGGKPLLEGIIENFVAQGFRQFYISVNYKSEMIKEYFGDGKKWGAEIRYLNENDALGTAGALSLIEECHTQQLIVMNADLMTDVNFSKMLDFHIEMGGIATMGVREYDFQVQFGVVELEDGAISTINEKPVQRFLVNGGIYILEPKILDLVPSGEFFDMPALFDMLIEQKEMCSAFPIHEYWLDVGRIEDLENAEGHAQGKKN